MEAPPSSLGGVFHSWGVSLSPGGISLQLRRLIGPALPPELTAENPCTDGLVDRGGDKGGERSGDRSAI